MNKEEIQVSDLVQWIALYPLVKGGSLSHRYIGLVVSVDRAADWLDANKYARYRVYWFKLGKTNFNYESQIRKLCPTQEKQNE